jgi:hypothetical protein
MKTGDVPCYFSPVNVMITDDISVVSMFSLEMMLKGWKVCVETDITTSDEVVYTIYWGA